MNDSIDDRLAVATAHDSLIARAISSSATRIARAWDTSAVRRRWQPLAAGFSTLTPVERLRFGVVALTAAVVTRLFLLLL